MGLLSGTASIDDDDDGPPGLEGDDDGPPGLEKDGAAPPGGSDSYSDSDADSDDSDDSGPPGLEDTEEQERAARAARKAAKAAPAPAPAPLLSKSQAKAAKAKRQKMRKQAAFADTLKKGSKVFVTKKGVETCVEINQELGYPEKYCVDLGGEPPRHRADAVTGTTSRRWRQWGARNLIFT